MAILKISEELSRDISTKSLKIEVYHQSNIDLFLESDNSFQVVFRSAKKMLEENYYVLIKNIGFVRKKNIFESFVKLFGEYYGAIEYTDIKLDCPYTGCKTKSLSLHNDDAIDIGGQPKYGFIQIQKEDPLKITKNGMVLIDDMVSYLQLHNNDLFNNLLNIKIKMLAYGVNYDGNDKNEIIINEPILYYEDDKINVRFDLTRINYYYWSKKITPSNQEKLLIDEFLLVANKFRKEMYLEEGDILIHDNLRTLHDRTECTLELNLDGTFNTREIFVSFTR
ncbi:MAG: Unknown protein [uncultured Sulfurovum sp.]|uniref:Uncharacterized protein n=1 Tax=uncultured Sulfurovum sp. TaxID=269237 RepID=A0A6S6T3E1_9BACT|nr:MAG: Unknown protein [uncultured Sulfurovum sp.]